MFVEGFAMIFVKEFHSVEHIRSEIGFDLEGWEVWSVNFGWHFNSAWGVGVALGGCWFRGIDCGGTCHYAMVGMCSARV